MNTTKSEPDPPARDFGQGPAKADLTKYRLGGTVPPR